MTCKAFTTLTALKGTINRLQIITVAHETIFPTNSCECWQFNGEFDINEVVRIPTQ